MIEKTIDIEKPEEPIVEEKEVEIVDDLDTLSGVGPKYQELLRSAGIQSKKGLAKESPEELFNKLMSANEEKEITKRPPTLENVESWINLARE